MRRDQSTPARDPSWSMALEFGRILTVVGLLAWATSSALAWQQNAPDDPSGGEVLTRGPVHEAFAEPVVFDPQAALVVPKAPPEAIEEQPPEDRPEGADVQWIPGYWSWDDERNEFLWISGLWRDVPPGRQWVPGYWSQVQGGYQWNSGFWADANQPDAANVEGASGANLYTYLPQPPTTLEVGPNSPQPGAGYFWTPGCWMWNSGRYAWRPGYWVQARPNWIWVPPCYYPTPCGYVYVQGYWDYPVARRGVLFAPVAFTPAVIARPQFVYTPAVVIPPNALVANLFCRPRYRHYYFGDYYSVASYGASTSVSITVGRSPEYIPWFAMQQTRYGYDPIYANVAAINIVNDPGWSTRVREVYVERVNRVDLRPPRTWAAARTRINNNNNVNIIQKNKTVVNNVTNVTNVTNITNITNNNVAIAAPLKQVVNNNITNTRFVKVEGDRRVEIDRRQREVRQFRDERARSEREARPANVAQRPGGNPNANPNAGNGGPPAEARVLKMSRSPITAAQRLDRPRGDRDGDGERDRPDRPQTKGERPAAKAERPDPRPDRPAVKGERPAPKAERPDPRPERPAGKAERPDPRPDRPQPKAERPQPKMEQRERERERERERIRDRMPPPPPVPSPNQGQPKGQRPRLEGDRPVPKADRPQMKADRPQPKAERPAPRAERPQPVPIPGPERERPQPKAMPNPRPQPGPRPETLPPPPPRGGGQGPGQGQNRGNPDRPKSNGNGNGQGKGNKEGKGDGSSGENARQARREGGGRRG